MIPLLTAIGVIAMAGFTAFVSGIFGMAGGMMLMGVLALLLPVQAALVTHGILQLVANGWRAILHRRHVQPAIFGWFAAATVTAATVFLLISWTPSKLAIFLLLGFLPVLVWLPRDWFAPDASRPPVAFAAGFIATAMTLTSGVSGALIDTVFVRTGITRHQIVATKAAIQCLNHLSKIIVYGLMIAQSGGRGMPPVWLFALAIPVSIMGTMAGGRVLDRMSDTHFKRWTAWIVTAIGLAYLVKAAQLVA